MSRGDCNNLSTPDKGLCTFDYPSLDRSKPKYAVFIRDVPYFNQEPLLHQLLVEFHSRYVYPNFTYSLVELLKYEQNIIKLKEYGIRKKDSAVVIANGCSLLMKDMIERAIKSSPELLVMDYMSETFVDIRRITEYASQRDYKVFFLKNKFGLSDPSQQIRAIVEEICSNIHNQDLRGIRRQQELDRCWNSAMGFHIEHTPPKPFPHKKGYCNISYTRSPVSSIVTGDHVSNEIINELPCAKPLNSGDEGIFSTKVADLYLDAMGKILRSYDLANHVKSENGISGDHCKLHKFANHSCTFIIVKDANMFRIPQERLFDTFTGKLQAKGVAFHLIPIGDVVINSKIKQVMDTSSKIQGRTMLRNFNSILLDTFIHLYDKEDVVVLDCIDESLETEQYIGIALENNWTVYILEGNIQESKNIRSMDHVIREILRKD